MAEYVKREDMDAVFKKIANDYYDSEMSSATALHVMVRLLSGLPAADVVEVVRCKDCKHCSLLFGKSPLCLAGSARKKITENDFCAWGERKTNDGT